MNEKRENDVMDEMGIEEGVNCIYREMEEMSKDKKGWCGVGWVWYGSVELTTAPCSVGLGNVNSQC